MTPERWLEVKLAALTAYGRASLNLAATRAALAEAPWWQKPKWLWRVWLAEMTQHGCYVTIVELNDRHAKEVETNGHA